MVLLKSALRPNRHGYGIWVESKGFGGPDESTISFEYPGTTTPGIVSDNSSSSPTNSARKCVEPLGEREARSKLHIALYRITIYLHRPGMPMQNTSAQRHRSTSTIEKSDYEALAAF